MRKIVSLALLALALGLDGCATTSSHYGNFVQSAELDQQKLATDAVQQLATLYAPARTHLELQQPTPDPFGQALVKSLRDKGYALLEYTSASAASQPSASATTAAPGGLPLRYVLDQAGDSNLYRLTLMVGNQSITRPYLAQNGTLVPAGYWARKE
ncbi:conjugal transfer protein TrbH [Xanthomonas translucens]|uniref:conjugal transfer protein TrbH n=1 Tax=Xanthomonas campestris pv. translucens TaxID=343 RepID=UPI0019D70E0F|nr:conjugal transfer protein TrbH [Xanthomonas translucens]QSQ62191.1 conjugal transfer protein TrbH [Xanthomonas translucens pv. undulosa]